MLCCGSELSYAQTNLTIPESARPERIERQFEVPLTPKSGADIQLERSGPDSGPENADSIRFQLRRLTIDGGTVYDDRTLSPLFANKVGQSISLAELYAMATQISAMYRRDGYFLSQAVVPAQSIENGNVRLQIVEGYIDHVIIEGKPAINNDRLRSMVEKITEERPLKVATLERYLLLLGDAPGHRVRSVIRPSQSTGASELVILVEHDDVEMSFNTDNHGTRFAGPIQISTTALLNSAFNTGDRTALRAVTSSQTDELRFFDLNQDFLLDGEGTRAGFSIGRTEVSPGFTLRRFDIDSTSNAISLNASHPIIRSRAENLFARLRFDYRDTQVDADNHAQRVSEDRLRSLRANVSYDFIDTGLKSPATSLLTFEISQGLTVLGANPADGRGTSQPGGRPDYTKFTLDAQRLQSLGGPFSLLAAVSGQYALTPLLSGERIGYGGSLFGRGYDPSEISGDHGILSKLELQWTTQESFRDISAIVQLYSFFDFGNIWLAQAPAAAAVKHESAAATGVGMRLTLDNTSYLFLEGTQPLTRPAASRGEDGKDPRFYFGVSHRF